MHEPKPFKQGDACPGCGGTLRRCPQPTDAEREAAKDRDNWRPLPPHYDTAPKEVVAELGELWKCTGCGYPARFKPDAAKHAAADGAGTDGAHA